MVSSIWKQKKRQAKETRYMWWVTKEYHGIRSIQQKEGAWGRKGYDIVTSARRGEGGHIDEELFQMSNEVKQ